MSHRVEILQGAFIVSDAHYSHKRPNFLNFLKDIHSKKLLPTQLILMGDVFDALFGGVGYTLRANKEAIKLIDEISSSIEIIYLEGNHDFNIKNIFLNVKVFPIQSQPVEAIYRNKKILLAHGDIESDYGYRLYTSIIRKPLVLSILSIVDSMFFNFIIRKLDGYLSKKDDCNEFNGFEKFIRERLIGKYNCEYFIEGHFHQNKVLKFNDFTYINLGAFACNQRYFIVQSTKEVELLQEKSFSEGI